MKGRILDYSIQANEGIISGDDGERYSFPGSEWKSQEPPKTGMIVDFVTKGNQAQAVYPVAGSASSSNNQKSRITAGLLAIFFGGFGIHKFYLGYKNTGIIHLIAAIPGTLLVIPAAIICIIGLIEGIIYLTMSDEDFYRTYVENQKHWF